MNYANQQVARIQSLGSLEHKKDEKRPDGTIKDFLVALNWDENLDMLYVLNGNEYKVWLYFLKWRGKAEGYQISPANIEKALDISESTFRRTKKRFLELGILKQISPNIYDFIPYPPDIHKKANDIYKDKYGEERKV